MKVIVGLGNPGAIYAETRHNMGFMVVDRIAATHKVAIDEKRWDSLVGEGSIDGIKIALAKPQTFMNRSGSAVASLLQKSGVGADALVVITDDLDLPFGRIRIRPNGGAGGHRGLASIIEALGETPFQRVRVGVGRPPFGEEPADYVLEPFGADEREQLPGIVDRAAESVIYLVREGPERAMALYNRAIE